MMRPTIAGPTSRWRFAVLPLVMLSITLPNVLRNRGGLAAARPVWRPLVAEMLLVVAGGIVVAAVAFGVATWRSARA